MNGKTKEAHIAIVVMALSVVLAVIKIVTGPFYMRQTHKRVCYFHSLCCFYVGYTIITAIWSFSCIVTIVDHWYELD
jgi:multisubunit Na+/H+ antiporter MnhF subunit